MRDVESFADFGQYYSGHYVLSQKDDKAMYMVNGFVDGGRARMMMTLFRDGVWVSEAQYTEQQVWDTVQFGLPEIGMTVFADELLYLYYRTARNGGRGFTRDRVVQCSHNGFELSKYGLPKFPPSALGEASNAWIALTPRYTTLQAAWEDFDTGPNRLAYALNRVFGVYMSAKPHPILCYRMHEIGEVLGPDRIRLHKRHEEYLDAVRRSLGAQLEITVQ